MVLKVYFLHLTYLISRESFIKESLEGSKWAKNITDFPSDWASVGSWAIQIEPYSRKLGQACRQFLGKLDLFGTISWAIEGFV